MELQDFISHTADYEGEFRKMGLQVKKRSGLLLVKYPYGMDLANCPEWVRQCRGAVIDRESASVVCLPPTKATERPIEELFQSPEETETETETEVQVLVDGTMVNLFYHKGEWVKTTRGSIGAHNTWDTRKSFKTMFEECGTIDYDTLDPACCYSFVMRHRENRIVSPVYANELWLVDVYRRTDEGIRRLRVSDYPQLSMTGSIVETFTRKMYDVTRELPFYCKGYTEKQGSMRYKYLNPEYLRIRSLKPNTNSPYLNYLELRQNGNLKEYLRYFPEDVEVFGRYRNHLHILTNELYETYKQVHILKQMAKEDIPYHLKPLLYDVHGIYLTTKQPTTWAILKQYIHELPPKKLLFALNYSGISKKQKEKEKPKESF
jgi:hypothetical protein